MVMRCPGVMPVPTPAERRPFLAMSSPPSRRLCWESRGRFLLVARDERAKTVVVVVDGPALDAHVPLFCGRVLASLARGDVDEVTLDVRAVVAPNAATVDALARAQLLARRLGGSIRLQHAGEPLRELLALAGLLDVLPC